MSTRTPNSQPSDDVESSRAPRAPGGSGVHRSRFRDYVLYPVGVVLVLTSLFAIPASLAAGVAVLSGSLIRQRRERPMPLQTADVDHAKRLAGTMTEATSTLSEAQGHLEKSAHRLNATATQLLKGRAPRPERPTDAR